MKRHNDGWLSTLSRLAWPRRKAKGAPREEFPLRIEALEERSVFDISALYSLDASPPSIAFDFSKGLTIDEGQTVTFSVTESENSTTLAITPDANSTLSSLVNTNGTSSTPATATFVFKATDLDDNGTGFGFSIVSTGGKGDTKSFDVSINAVQDAPVLAAAAPTLTGILEDPVTNAGDKVSTIVAATITDPDFTPASDAAKSIAVTKVDNSKGSWEYSTDGGSNWLAFSSTTGSVVDLDAASQSRLLTEDDFIRFTPVGNYNGTATFSYRAWDETSGTAHDVVQIGAGTGGANAFSSQQNTATVTVSPDNDAPVLAAAAPTLSGTTEGTASSPGDKVSAIVGATITDPDVGTAPQSIAVTKVDNTGGLWQFSANGSSWSNFTATTGSVDLAALNQSRLLSKDYRIRFNPTTNFYGSTTFEYRAWDETSGTAGAVVTISATGGTSPFSSGVNTAALAVSGVNDAPVVPVGTTNMTGISEDPSPNNGQSVASIVGTLITDVDYTPSSDALKSIVVRQVDNTNGKWQYWVDGGSAWSDFTATTGSNVTLSPTSQARLLSKDDLVRFVPNANYNGSSSFEYRAWDESDGKLHGSAIMIPGIGGAAAYSDDIRNVSLAVSAVNDAPVLAAASPTLTGITEDPVTNGGNLVSAIVGATISDVDVGTAPQSIAVTQVDNTGGLWQYSVDGGTKFLDFTTTTGVVDLAASGEARLLTKNNLVRFNPNGDYFGSNTFQYRAWDQTSGTAGAAVTISATGGATAFSGQENVATLAVAPVNDAAPVIAAGKYALPTIVEDPTTNGGTTVALLVGTGITDADYTPSSDALKSIAVTAVDNTDGAWEYSIDGGTNWLTFTSKTGGVDLNADSATRLLSEDDRIRFVPNANFSGNSETITFQAWDESNGLLHGAATKITGSGGGTTAYSTGVSARIGSISITAVADAPTLTVPASYSGTEGGAISITGISAALTDTDGSESISRYTIDASALSGVSFNQFTSQSGGIWFFTPAQMSGLTMTADDTNGAAVNLSVTARSKEGSNSATADSAAQTIAVTIANAAPVATITVNPGASAAEGTSLTYKGTFTDAGAAGDDKYLVTWTAVGGAENTVFTEALSYGQTSTFTFAPADDAAYTVTMKVQDEYDSGAKTFAADSLSGSKSAALTVVNAAPTTTLVSQPTAAQLVEGNTLAFQVRGDDDGAADKLSYEYAWYFLGKDGLGVPTSVATSPTDAGLAPGTVETVTFTPAGDGKYELRFKVSDDDSASVASTYSFTVANVDPAEDAGNTTVPAADVVTEGNVFQIDYAFTDPAFPQAAIGDETYSISVDWGDGSAAEAYTPTVVDGSAGTATKGTAALKHVYADGQATGYTVSITVTDGDGGSSTTVHTATIKNAAPAILTKAGAQSIVEGGTLTFTAGSPLLTFSDPGFSEGSTFETFKVSIDWGDGNVDSNLSVGTVTNGTRTDGTTTSATTGYVAASHKYLDNQAGNAPYTVTVTLVDDDGGTSSFTMAVTVADQAPAPTIDAHPATGAESTVTTFTGSFTDPAGAADANYGYAWSVAVSGNAQIVPTVSGTATAPGALGKSLSFTPIDAGVYTVTLTVTDADAVVGTRNFIYTVTNSPPTADVSAPAGTLDEGSPLSFDLTATTASTGDLVDYAYEIFYLGKTGLESHSVQTGSALNKTSGDVVSIGFTPADEGKYRVDFTATDDDGAVGADTTNFTVANVVPTVTGAVVPGADVVSEGQVFSIDYAFSDPGFSSAAATSSETFKITVEWGDGNTEVFTPTPANGSAGKDTTGSIKLSHAYADGKAGAYSVKVTLADDDGGSVSNTYSATIKNVAPTIGATAADQTVLEGQALVFDSTTPLLTFTDPGFNENLLVESYAVTVDWGDGNVDVDVPVATFTNGVRIDGTTTTATSGYVGISHTYADNLTGNAPYTVTVTFKDDDGGSVSTSLKVTVQNVAPNPSIGGPTTGDEGANAVFTGSFSDPGQGNDANYSYSWSTTSDNGQTVAPLSGKATSVGSVPSYAFTAQDEGKYTVSLTIVDADGGSTTKTYDYTVSNVAPTVVVTSEPAGKTTVEGGGVVYQGAFSDPGAGFDDGYTYSWTATSVNGDSFTKTGALNYGDAIPDFAFTPTNDGAYTVTLQVADDVGASQTASTSLTATNTAPAVSITGAPAGSTDEGSTVSYKAVFTDAAGAKDDFFFYTWTATGSNGDSFSKTGTATYAGAGTSVPDFSFTPTDDGTYTVAITVRDEGDASGKVFAGDSATGGASTSLTVLNVAPTVTITSTPGGGSAEGAEVAYQGSFTDPAQAQDDFYFYTWTAAGSNGDLFIQNGTVNYGGGSTSVPDFKFTPSDDGAYTITLVVRDESDAAGALFGGDSLTDSDGAALSVSNVAPAVTISGGPTTSDEGLAVSYAGSFTDPALGNDDVYVYTWTATGSNGDVFTKTGTINYGGASTTVPAFAFTPTNDGVYAVTLTVQDEADSAGKVFSGDSLTGTDSETLTVANVAPSVTIASGPTSGGEGGSVTYTGAFTDLAGTGDSVYVYTWTAVGTNGESFSTTGLSGYGGSPTSVPSFSFTPTNDGVYTVTLTVRDEADGAGTTFNADSLTGSAARTLTVSNLAPTVTIAPPPFGASVGEGTSVTYVASFTDPGQGKDDTYVYTWTATSANGDSFTKSGTLAYAGGATNVPAFTFTPTDDGAYTVTIRVRDEADASGTIFNADSLTGNATVGLTSTNVLPAPVVAAGPGLSPEGLPVTFKGGFFDPGLNKDADYAVVWTATGDNGQTVVFSTTATGVGPVADFVFTPDDDGTYTITLTVVDDDGGSKTSTTASLVVTDVPPTATIFDPVGGTAGFTGLEGGGYTFTGFFFDNSTKEKYDVHWQALDSKGNVLDFAKFKGVPLGKTPDFTFNPGDDDDFTIRLTVVDGKGNQTVDEYAFDVANVVPTVLVASPAGSTGNEGTPVTFTGSFTDPANANDADYAYVWTVAADNGQSVPVVAGSNTATGAVGASLTFTPVNDGVYTIRLTVTDDDGGQSFDEFTYTVNNVAPTVSVTSPADEAHSDEGTALAYQGTFSDPGAAADDTYVYTWTAVGDDGQTYTKTGNVAYTGSVTIVPAFSFTPVDDTHFTVTLTVQDDPDAAQSQTGTDAVDLYVDNVAPAPSLPSGPATAAEGDVVVYKASFFDPGGVKDATYDVVWTAVGSNGQTATFTTTANSPGGVAPFSFTLEDDGTYTITVTITDKDGAFTTSMAASLTVSDVPPTVVVLDPLGGTAGYTGVEGTSYVFTGSFTDPSAAGRESYSATWTVFRGSSLVPMTTQVQGGVALAGAVNSLTFTPPDDDVYRIVLTVVDDSGHSNSQEYSFQATNVVPDPVVTGPTSGLEGQSVSFGGSFFDPADGFDATYQYSWSVVASNGQSIPVSAGTAGGNGPVGGFSFTPFDDGVYTITLSVVDKNGAVGTQDFTFTSANDDPTAVVAVEPAPAALVEGNLLSFSLQGTDPGSNDALAYDYEFYFLGKSGTDVPILLAAGGATGKATGDLLAASFTPPDDGVYELRFRVTDDDGGTDEVVHSYTVVNADPSGSIFTTVPAAGSVTEGQLFQIHYNFTDPGYSSAVTKTSETFTILVDWGDGTPAEAYTPTVTNGSAGGLTIGAVEFKHRYADDVVGGYNVVVTVTDDDGGVLVENFTAEIANSAPSIISASGTQTVNEGSVLAFSGDYSSGSPLLRFEDLGFTEGKNSEDFFVDIDWGDGTKELNVPVTTVVQGTRTDGVTVTRTQGYVPASHVYDDNLPSDAPYWVEVTLRDDDGGEVLFGFYVIVRNVVPDVAVTGPTDGDEGTAVTFAGSFNDPGGKFDGAYDYQWTITSSNGQTVPGKSGNALLPPGGSSVTFTPFDDGTYTITLSVTDNDGAVGSKSFTFTARNVDPTASIYLTPNAADLVEGKTITYGLEGTDVGSNDVLTYAYQLYYLGTDGKAAPVQLEGGVQINVPASGVKFGYDFAAPDNGSYRLVFTATDDDGGSTTDVVDFEIANVAPTIDGVFPIYPGAFDQIDEGYGVYFSFTFSDPGYRSDALGTNETFTAFIDWGDGTSDVYVLPSTDPNGYGVVSPGGPGTRTSGEVVLWHVFADNGFYNVRIRVLDDDGGLGAASPIVMEVHNVAPFFYGDALGGMTFVQGDVVTINIPFYDPGFKTETFTVSIDYGGMQSLLLSSPTLYRDPADPNQQAYLQAVLDTQQFFLFGQFSMTVTITDDDGGSATVAIPVSVIENPNFRFDLPTIETPSLTVPPPAPAVAPQTVQGANQGVQASNESRGGSRSSPPPKKLDLLNNIRLLLRVDRLKSFRGAVEKVELNDVLQSSDLMAYRDKLSRLGHGVFRITLSSEGAEAQSQEIELTQDNSSKAWRLLDSLMKRLESQFDPEQELQNLIPIPGTTHMDAPSGGRRLGADGIRVGDLERGPVPGAPPTDERREADRGTGRKVSTLGPSEMFDGTAALDDLSLFDGAALRSGALAALAATWAGRRSPAARPRRGKALARGEGATAEDGDLDVFFDWLGRGGGGAGGG